MRPLVVPAPVGARYRTLRLTALEGSTQSVPDEAANGRHLGLPGTVRGRAELPRRRLTILAELGTRAAVA